MNEEEIKAIEILKNECANTYAERKALAIDVVLKLVDKQQAELELQTLLEDERRKQLEKKDMIIDLMAEKLKQLREASLDDCFIPRSFRDIDDCLRTTCEECIKEYFENKVKESK